MTAPRVSILVPAYRAGAFLGRTLRSVGGQTVDDYRVIVSIDDADAQTVAAAEDFAADPRLTIIRQSRRLGFVGNINFLLDRVDTRFFCILPHDDEIAPRYLEALLAAAEANPAASVVFTDMRQHIGDLVFELVMRPLDGDLVERIANYYGSIPGGLPMRGLSPGALLRSGLRMPDTLPDGRAADMIYVLSLLIQGPGIRVAEPLYDKHLVGQSTSLGWGRRSEDDPGWRMASWTPAVVAQLRMLAALDLPEPERLACMAACLGHTMARRADTTGVTARGGVDGDLLLFTSLLTAELLSGLQPGDDATAALANAPAFAIGVSRLLTARAADAHGARAFDVSATLAQAALTTDPGNQLARHYVQPAPPSGTRMDLLSRLLGRKR
ncbi:MAG: glycosyltransferase family 2 protein [Azospirillaceae bacterium]